MTALGWAISFLIAALGAKFGWEWSILGYALLTIYVWLESL